jgi:hypothetical protein
MRALKNINKKSREEKERLFKDKLSFDIYKYTRKLYKRRQKDRKCDAV